MSFRTRAVGIERLAGPRRATVRMIDRSRAALGHMTPAPVRREHVVAGVVALAFAVAVGAGEFWAFVAALAAVYALLGLSLVVVAGWSGQLNLHVAALGLGWGAYAAFAFSIHGPTLFALVAAGIVTIPFSIVVGVVAVRFRGLELAVATLALGLTFERLLFRNLGEFLSRGSGSATPFESSFVPMTRPKIGDTTVSSERIYAVVCIAVLAVVFVLVRNLSNRSTRRILVAIRDGEVAAEVAGVPTLRYRIGAFVGSVAIAATAGGLFASLKRGIAPDSFGLDLSFLILSAVVIGGLRSIWGGVLAGVMAGFLPEIVRFGPFTIFGGERLFFLFAVAMVLTLWLSPDGLAGRHSSTKTEGEADDSLGHPESLETVAVTAAASGPRRYASASERHRERCVLRASDISVRFGGIQALAGVDLWIPEGEICSLIGPNGAGKSTLFNCLSGVVVPDAGSVYLDGEDVTHMPPHRRAHRGLGRTFQSVELFGGLTVLENVMVGGVRPGAPGPAPEALGMGVARAHERFLADRAMAMLAELGLADDAHRIPDGLPFGSLRRLEIGVALMGSPSVLLLDEPSAGLNPEESADLAAFIARLRDDRGVTVLLVEHDMAVVGEISDWVYVLDFGRLIASGPPDAVREDPLVVARYLGDEVDLGSEVAGAAG